MRGGAMTEIASKIVVGVLAALVLVLVCVSLLVAGQRNEARRQRDAALSTVRSLTADLSTCRGNTATLQVGIDAQNLAVDQLRQDAARRQETGARALQSAQATTRALAEQNRVLHAIIQTTKPETCDATFDAARAGLRR